MVGICIAPPTYFPLGVLKDVVHITRATDPIRFASPNEKNQAEREGTIEAVPRAPGAPFLMDHFRLSPSYKESEGRNIEKYRKTEEKSQ